MRRIGRAAAILLAGVALVLGVPGISQATTQANPISQLQTNPSYNALGDSFATGTGTGTQDNCGRVANAYPKRVFDIVQYQSGNFPRGWINLACNGATTDTVMQQQLDVPFYGLRSNHLTTLSVGGNDVGALAFGGTCVLSDCTQVAPQEIAAIQTVLPSKLAALYARLATKINSGDQVLIMGYPDVLSGTGSYDPICLAVTPAERAAAHQVALTLDATIAAAVQNTHDSRFVYVTALGDDSPFAGHGLCSTQPYFQGTGNPMPLHPNAAGTEAFTRLVWNNFVQVIQEGTPVG